ncbi:MAG: hypothetical protein AAGG68_23785 [Bacteroidota bacterium]
MMTNVEEVKTKVHAYVDLLDEHFLKVVYSMLNTHLEEQSSDSSIVGYDIEGQPKYARDMKIIYDKEVENAVKEDAYVSTNEIREKAKKWLNNTK